MSDLLRAAGRSPFDSYLDLPGLVLSVPLYGYLLHLWQYAAGTRIEIEHEGRVDSDLG